MKRAPSLTEYWLSITALFFHFFNYHLFCRLGPKCKIGLSKPYILVAFPRNPSLLLLTVSLAKFYMALLILMSEIHDSLLYLAVKTAEFVAV